MSQISNHRRGRAIRRGVAVFLILVVGPAAYLIYDRTRDRTPEVRTAILAQGAITSVMTITTSIRPGAIQQTGVSRQLVKEVMVQLGDQVSKGDPLITFDLTGLTDQLAAASAMRGQAEAAAAEVAGLATAQAADSQQTIANLQTQINKLSSGLSGTVGSLAQLNSISPTEVIAQDGLAAGIAAQLAAIDPESADAAAQIQQLLDILIAGIQVEANPDYQQQLAALNKSVNKMSSALAGLSASLSSTELQSGLLGSSSAASQITSLATSAQTAVTQAAQAEALARAAVEGSRETIFAELDGVVAQVNAVTGQYAGTASSSAGSSLSSLLGDTASAAGSSLGSLAASQDPVIVIYDNTRPKAYFQANRYDSAKLAVGQLVVYHQDDQTWYGRITYKGRIANNVSLEGGSTNSILGSVSSVSGLTTEPMTDLEMSIEGDDLTDLTLGFNLDAEIQTAAASDVLLLPAEAMKKELGEYYAFVVGSDGRLTRRTFTPGIQSDLFAEIIAGLQAGDRVVLNPSNDLIDGLLVKEKNDG